MKSASTTKKSSSAKSAATPSKASPARKSTNSAKSAFPAKAAPAKKSSRSNAAQTQTQVKQTPFEKLFVDLLKDVYWAEQHLVKSLPDLINAATTNSLKESFENHLELTNEHVTRVEKVFDLLGVPAEAVKCDAMDALVKEANKVIEETPEGSMTRDAGLIISAQKVEHYEIASYGSLVQVALTLEHYKAADLLEMTLMEEEDTDRELTMIAESEINPIADEEGSEEGVDENSGEQEEEE